MSVLILFRNNVSSATSKCRSVIATVASTSTAVPLHRKGNEIKTSNIDSMLPGCRVRSRSRSTHSLSSCSCFTYVKTVGLLKRKTATVPLNFAHIGRQTCPDLRSNGSLRFYSGDKSGGDESNYQFDESENNIKQSKEDHVIRNDPELQSILEDFKKDFAEVGKGGTSEGSSHSRSRSNSVDTEENESTNFAGNNAASSSHRLNSTLDDFSYAYQVAEDIEEYDYLDESELQEQQVRPEKVSPISLDRGKAGVFELEELLLLLDTLGAEDVVTVPIPEEANYCDHIVVASAKSKRHLQAINDEMLWVHKRKKVDTDPTLRVEGLDGNNWSAMDIGNIVLHVFFGELREFYDIESLWTLGPEKDPNCKQENLDPYALSAEDKFWLEAGADRLGDTPVLENELSQLDDSVFESGSRTNVMEIRDADAGWNQNNPRVSE